VDLSIDGMDVGLLKKCFQQRLEDVIIYLLQNCGCRTTVQISVNTILAIITASYNTYRLAPRPPRQSGRLRQSWIEKSRRIYVRPRTGPHSAHLWWPAVAKLQATSVSIA